MRIILYYIVLIVIGFALIFIFSFIEAILKLSGDYYALMNACMTGTIVAMTKDKIKKLICKSNNEEE